MTEFSFSNLPEDTPEERSRLDKLASSIVSAVVMSAIRDGEVDTTGMMEAEAKATVQSFLARIVAESGDFSFIIDHTPDLLRQAAGAVERGDMAIAAILYATWVEHWVNGLINSLLKRRGLEESVTVEVIRDTPFRGKMTWLLQVLGAPSLDAGHLGKILNLVELRNEYVHYKWKSYEEGVLAQRRNTLKMRVETIAATIAYLLDYEQALLYAGQSDWVLRAFGSGNSENPLATEY